VISPEHLALLIVEKVEDGKALQPLEIQHLRDMINLRTVDGRQGAPAYKEVINTVNAGNKNAAGVWLHRHYQQIAGRDDKPNKQTVIMELADMYGCCPRTIERKLKQVTTKAP